MEGFMTVAQTADFYGVAQGTVYRWLDNPRVPLTKHKSGDGRVWISEKEAQEWKTRRSTPIVVTVGASEAGA